MNLRLILFAAAYKSFALRTAAPNRYQLVLRIGSALPSHLDYWTRHSLPVLVVLHEPDTDMTIWEVISPETVTTTGKGWKVTIPFKNTLTTSTQRAWAAIAEGPPYQRRLRALVLAKPWMNLIDEDGKRLFLEFEDWINKTSGRGSMRLLSRDDDDNEEVVEDWGEMMVPGQIYQELVLHLFPWAEFSIDDEFYESYDEAQHQSESGIFDGGELVMTTDSLTEWRKHQALLRPYMIEAGEVAKFRLELSINDLGTAFLRLDQYLDTGELQVREGALDMSTDYGSGLKSLARAFGVPMPGDPDWDDGKEPDWDDGEEPNGRRTVAPPQSKEDGSASTSSRRGPASTPSKRASAASKRASTSSKRGSSSSSSRRRTRQ